ncbi:MAG TPA: phosphoribosylformylglycinamidine cyclo-ligase [Bacteroidota bacterium]|nr:phosphoribosylformylglycinamidine cyclo-ligase [Bacteroidota bacterium]
MGKTYKESGVDIDAGENLVRRIKGFVKDTFSTSVLTDVGLFGAFFEPDFSRYQNPVLVSSVDGVGTKLKIAFMMNKHDTVGQDLVNHCVNDILVCGAKPLFFMDYYATGKLDNDIAEKVIYGLAKACKENGCSLIGGETAEMPGIYQGSEYDIAGTIVGVVDKSKIIKGDNIKVGNVLIGLPSTGLHTNGYSLARSVFFPQYKPDCYFEELKNTIGEELLKIHKSYLKSFEKIENKIEIRGMSHITGGGIIGNTMRIIPEGLSIKIDWNSWERLPIFSLIQKIGDVPEEDMRRTFNLGIGLIIIVDKNDVDLTLSLLKEESAIVIGEVIKA